MSDYRVRGPSKASATTLCQKCLKRGHYSYECTAPRQERPYVSRPSRTQQLLNPKLAPKNSSTKPATALDAMSEVTSAAEPTASKDSINERLEANTRRSRSSSSSGSVASISTRSSSDARSPPRTKPSGHRREQDPRSSSRRRDMAYSRGRSRSPFRARPDHYEKDTDAEGSSARRAQHISSRSRSPNARRRQSRERSFSPYRRRAALSGRNDGEGFG